MRRTFDQVVEIVRTQEPYAQMSRDELEARFGVPVDYGKAEMWSTREGPLSHIIFTWQRPATVSSLEALVRGYVPSRGSWQENGPRVWISDMMASPGTSGVDVGRFLHRVLLSEEICKNGDMVFYRRSGGAKPGRVGYSVIRERG